jgi:hypothetical protein
MGFRYNNYGPFAERKPTLSSCKQHINDGNNLIS